SRVRFPTTVTVLSAIGLPPLCVRHAGSSEVPVDVLGDAQDLVPENFVSKGEAPVQLVHRRGLGLRLEDHVVALPAVLELVREAPLAPEVGLPGLGATGLDQLDGAGDRGPDRLLFQIRVEDDHDLVRPHGPDLLRTVAPATGDRLTPDRDVPAWRDGRRNAIEPVRLAVARRCGSIETGRYNAPVTLYEGLTRLTRSLRA